MSGQRNLFDELMAGVTAMADQRAGKITLRTAELDETPPVRIGAAQIRETRERLNLSRAVFARGLRVSARTLENWEQGRAAPNPQAAALILMVSRYPDTFERLRTLDADAA